MKNSEVLAYKGSPMLLSAIDRQRRFVLLSLLTACACPNCGAASDYFTATGTEVDSLDLLSGAADARGTCSGCGRGLVRVVPLVALGGPGWRWELVPDPVAAAAWVAFAPLILPDRLQVRVWSDQPGGAHRFASWDEFKRLYGHEADIAAAARELALGRSYSWGEGAAALRVERVPESAAERG